VVLWPQSPGGGEEGREGRGRGEIRGPTNIKTSNVCEAVCVERGEGVGESLR